MIEEKLQLLSTELDTEFSFTIDDNGEMIDLTICEEQSGIPIPKFTIIVDEDNSDERYVLSVLESPLTIYFGSDICETAKIFVSPDIESVFKLMKEEVVNSRKWSLL